MKHFDLIASQRWDVLLDYMADFKVAKLKTKFDQVPPDVVKSWFTVKHLKDISNPKVLSHFEVPYEEKIYLQVGFWNCQLNLTEFIKIQVAFVCTQF